MEKLPFKSPPDSLTDFSTAAIGSGLDRFQSQPVAEFASARGGSLMAHALAPKTKPATELVDQGKPIDRAGGRLQDHSGQLCLTS
jgi:hypothetical protein